MAVRGERADERERALDLGRDGDNPDVGPGGRNLVQNRLTGEVAFEARVLLADVDTRGVGRRGNPG